MRIHPSVTTTAATLLAGAALAAPAGAMPVDDLRSPDARDAASAVQRPTQDLRSPDARDAARGPAADGTRWEAGSRALTEAPLAQTTIVERAPQGFEWGSAGIGAGAMIGVLAIALGGILLLRRRQKITPGLAG